MGLLPEFFTVLGVFAFLAISLITALLDEDFSPKLAYIFQGTAFLGLGLMIMSGSILNPDPTDPTRFWTSVVYLEAAVSAVFGVNIYLALVRRRIALASILSATVAVPTFVVSAIFVSSFLGTAGEVGPSPVTVVGLALSAEVVSLSVFGFLREAYKHIRNPLVIGAASAPTGASSRSPNEPEMGLPLQLQSLQGEEWEESPRKNESEDR
jgi:hypothetical protein